MKKLAQLTAMATLAIVTLNIHPNLAKANGKTIRADFPSRMNYDGSYTPSGTIDLICGNIDDKGMRRCSGEKNGFVQHGDGHPYSVYVTFTMDQAGKGGAKVSVLYHGATNSTCFSVRNAAMTGTNHHCSSYDW